MKVPDKIYLQTCGDCPGFECESCQFQDLAEVSWSEDKIFGTDKEYIRKEALIEWATNLKERWKEPPVSVHSPGCVYMLEQVINKINSL